MLAEKKIFYTKQDFFIFLWKHLLGNKAQQQNGKTSSLTDTHLHADFKLKTKVDQPIRKARCPKTENHAALKHTKLWMTSNFLQQSI